MIVTAMGATRCRQLFKVAAGGSGIKGVRVLPALFELGRSRTIELDRKIFKAHIWRSSTAMQCWRKSTSTKKLGRTLKTGFVETKRPQTQKRSDTEARTYFFPELARRCDERVSRHLAVANGTEPNRLRGRGLVPNEARPACRSSITSGTVE